MRVFGLVLVSECDWVNFWLLVSVETESGIVNLVTVLGLMLGIWVALHTRQGFGPAFEREAGSSMSMAPAEVALGTAYLDSVLEPKRPRVLYVDVTD